jgi:hypothetical protein
MKNIKQFETNTGREIGINIKKIKVIQTSKDDGCVDVYLKMNDNGYITVRGHFYEIMSFIESKRRVFPSNFNRHQSHKIK